MERSDRSAVLYATAYGPLLGMKVTLSYLRMKRAARRAEKGFYRELIRSGLPHQEAKGLAEEYGSAVSVRRLMSEVRLIDRMTRWQPRK
jgi:hypothetical protein